MKHTIRIERVYEDPAGIAGGFRVFVDRLWPRGESKEKFHYDLWAKDVTPSTAEGMVSRRQRIPLAGVRKAL